ncbi:hypothetical protein Bbelb_108740, partial [Branchiostoma belcheri]
SHALQAWMERDPNLAPSAHGNETRCKWLATPATVTSILQNYTAQGHSFRRTPYTGTFRLHDSVAQLSRDVWNEMDEDDQPFMERLEEGGVTILEQHRKRKKRSSNDQPFMERLEEGGVTILEQHRKRKAQRPTSMYEFPTRKYYLSRDPKDRSVQGNGLGLRVVGGKEIPGNGLGLRVVGGKEIPGGRGEIGAYVARIYPGGVAEQVEGLFEGAQVLEWNGAKLTGKTYEEVLKIVSVSNGEIEIVIRSDFNMLSDTQHQSAADRKRSGFGKAFDFFHQCCPTGTRLAPDSELVLGPAGRHADFAADRIFGPCRQYSVESAVDPDQLAAQLATVRGENRAPPCRPSASPCNIASPSLSTASSTAPSPILPASPALARQAPRKLPSKEASKETDITGEIELQMRYDETTKDLIININRARNLAAKDINGFSDPFVKVYLLPGRNAENKRRTKYIPKTLNPEWNQTVIYKGITKEQLKSKTVEFTVWDYDRFTPNDFLGEVLIDLSDASFLDNQPHWFTLYEHDENNSAELPKPKTLSPLTHSKAFHPHTGKPVDLQKSRSHQSLITAAVRRSTPTQASLITATVRRSTPTQASRSTCRKAGATKASSRPQAFHPHTGKPHHCRSKVFHSHTGKPVDLQKSRSHQSLITAAGKPHHCRSKAFHSHTGKPVDLQKSRSHQSLITAAVRRSTPTQASRSTCRKAGATKASSRPQVDEEEYEKARRRYYKAQSLTNIHQDEPTYRYRRTRSSLGEELTSDRRLSLQHGYGVSLPFREVSPSRRLMQQQAERRRGDQMSSVMSDSPLTYRKRFVNERHQPSSLARNHVSSSDTSIVQMRESPQMVGKIYIQGEDESSHSEPATPRSATERDRKVPSFHGKHDRDDLRKQVARKKLDSLGSSASSNGSLSSLQSGESSSTGYSGGTAPPSGWPGRQNLSGMGRHPHHEDLQRHHVNNRDGRFHLLLRKHHQARKDAFSQANRTGGQEKYQTWDTIEQQVDSEGNRMMSSPKHTMYSQMAVGELGPGQLMDPGSMEIHEQGEMLMVHIVNVQNITYRFKSDDYLPDLYVKCYLVVGNRKVAKKKTRTCKSDREPEFNEMLKFDLEFGKSILQVTNQKLFSESAGRWWKVWSEHFNRETLIWLDNVNLQHGVKAWYKLMLTYISVSPTGASAGNSAAVNLLEDGGKFGRNTLIGETLIWLDNVNLQHGVKAWYKLMLQPLPRVSPDRGRAAER